MRIIEPEGRNLAYLIIVVGVISAYFECYILGGILLFIILPLWLFFCSSKIINPTMPNAIVSPISGVILHINQSENEIDFCIKARFNGRIYSPSDLQNIIITHQNGFYGINNEFSKKLNANYTLNANSTLDNQHLDITIHIIPYIFRFCRIKFDSQNSLFLEKIGFLNLGTLHIKIKGDNIQSIAKKGDCVVGGNTALLIVKN